MKPWVRTIHCAYRKLDLGKKKKVQEPRRANHSRSRSRLASLAAKTGEVSASRREMLLVFVVSNLH